LKYGRTIGHACRSIASRYAAFVPDAGTPRLQDKHCKEYDANDLSAHASASPPVAGQNVVSLPCYHLYP
jgi:hypothetical protein